ncbi:hypothetical protein BCR41DRAFT_426169 [Lobosporangium transversale]|uniref:F-box domain-containing protein n=1 Tax=Lobosporangium transversale TaxID=64571 RepID=A0A1Y2GBX6_9FUNG|nr:hypothetical protein BCR41DRAFT_426169 [Lobosporangium transversale]ORZ01922.1 hypothetical protein BCR41DRAFT_426169 [Lobosporangium transversale]|eukprot:XP_021876175.1 hypothetical protein BCR41DRAFT_426169 [Lobosporangium transversale]
MLLTSLAAQIQSHFFFLHSHVSSTPSLRNMDNLKLNPFEIPEILLPIGELLDQKDILNCIRVSKAFHRTFISLIWRKIIVGPQRDPSSKAVQRHKEYIEEITFESYAFKVPFPEEFESLQRLQSIAYKGQCSWPTPVHLINQIKAHSFIITSFQLSDYVEYPPGFWEALLECTNLNHLEVNRNDIDVAADLFLQVCKKSWNDQDQPDFYKVVLLRHPWTLNNLSALYFFEEMIKDKDLAALLRRMTELKRLNVSIYESSQLSLQELLADKQEVMDNGRLIKTRLWRLCETVEMLVFETNNSGVAQTILSNCPRLKRLEGLKITVAEIVNGAEWVSTGLTHLIIHLEADVDQKTEEGMAKARIAFRQLADVNYQNCLDEKMKTTVHYNAAIINPALPTEDAEAARLKFEQMNKALTDKLDMAEVHYQMIKDLTDIQEAMNKTRQLVVAPNEERSLPEAETQDQLKNTIESFPKQRNHPGRVENHHPYQLGIRAQAADDKP